MSVPIYTNGALPGAHLVIDQATGLPVYQEQASALFTVCNKPIVCNTEGGGGGITLSVI